MKKSDAIKVFGTVSALARVLGCTPSAIFQWPQVLPLRLADRVIAACVRKGIDPTPLLNSQKAETEKSA